MAYAKPVKPGDKVNLNKIDPDDHGSIDKKEGLEKLASLGEKICALQELMFAAGKTGLLIVFQGRDTAGKDGAINRILSYVNGQGCRVAPFKVPTPIEMAHDFLWRVHQETPGLGGITLFNRSHYEDVLVVRVHGFAPEEVWSRRYDHINAFESLLTDSNTVVLKFMLHITKEEQEQRLMEREADAEKAWKLNVGDWKEREFWDDYTEAYNDAIAKCSTKNAPWIIVPANHKWYRDLVIAEAIHDALEPLAEGWRTHLADVGSKAKVDLTAYREEMKVKP